MRDRMAGLGILALCGGSIGALLADLYGVAQMAPIFVAVTLPSSIALIAIGSRPNRWQDTVRVGAIGGLLATIGYDLFRIPFMLAGMRVFAPISSYGLMAAAADQSTGLTTVLGWSYHVSNGIAFGIAYMLFAKGRSRWWGVGWGLLLEGVAFVGPFTARYGLTGKVAPIAVAFAAHVAYGYPLGVVGERFETVRAWIGRRRLVVARSLAAAFGGLLLLFTPWSASEAHDLALTLADEIGEPVAVLDGTKFQPEWLRIEPGGCVVILNRGDFDAATDLGVVPAHGPRRWCPDEPGAHRVRVDGLPWSGGFVLVDD